MSLSISDLWDLEKWADELVDSANTEGSSVPTDPRVNEAQLVGSLPVEPPTSTPQPTSGNVDPTNPTQALFVKVHMEGVLIGRKLNILSYGNYADLIATLSELFGTTIRRTKKDGVRLDKYHVLIYEDKDGDWMMAGDVPWEMFVTTVRRLKITRADNC